MLFSLMRGVASPQPRYMVRHSPKQTVVQPPSPTPGQRKSASASGDWAKRLGTERRLLLGDLQGCPFVCHCLGAFNATHALWLLFESCPGGALSSTLDALEAPKPNDRQTDGEARRQSLARQTALTTASGRNRLSLGGHPAVANELAAALGGTPAASDKGRNATAAADDAAAAATGSLLGPLARQWSLNGAGGAAAAAPLGGQRAAWRRQRRSASGLPPRLNHIARVTLLRKGHLT